MPVQAVTFDAANTLMHVDWNPVHMAVQAANELGINLDLQVAGETYQRLLASSWTMYQEINRDGDEEACRGYWFELTGDWLTRMGKPIEFVEPLVKSVEQRMFGINQECFQVFDDVWPTLKALKERGLRLAVISNWDYTLHAALRTTGLIDEFEQITASLRFGAEKPDPSIFLHTLELMDLNPDQALHIGDDPMADFHGARKAGLEALIIDRSAHKPTNHILTDLRQLPDKL